MQDRFVMAYAYLPHPRDHTRIYIGVRRVDKPIEIFTAEAPLQFDSSAIEYHPSALAQIVLQRALEYLHEHYGCPMGREALELSFQPPLYPVEPKLHGITEE